MKPILGENFYDAFETAALFGVDVDTVRRWCSTGKWKGKARKIGKGWMIPERLIKELVGSED